MNNDNYLRIMGANLTNIGQRLIYFRKSLGLSQLEFSKKAGLSRSYITHVETEKVNPSFEFLLKISSTYNLSINWLLFENGQMLLLPGDHYLNYLDNDLNGLIESIIKQPKSRQKKIVKLCLDVLDIQE